MARGRSAGEADDHAAAGISTAARRGVRLRPFGLADLSTSIWIGFHREMEERRFFPWLAVAFAGGAGLYFIAPEEPHWAIPLGGVLLFGLLGRRAWVRGATWRTFVVLAMIFAGASAAKVRVESLVGPEILRPFAADVGGRVVDAEARAERRPRIVLADVTIAGQAAEHTPRRLRLSLAPDADLPAIGSRISVRARLMPVSGPAVPGAYDPHRAAFFDGIGGTGFALGDLTEVAGDEPALSPGERVRAIRIAVVERVVAADPGPSGAVAAALLVGDRTHIPEAVTEDLRLSGLSHVLSISGLHMMLIAGTAFFAVRAILAASYRLALTGPIRKIAAVAALMAAIVYLTLSGGGAATTRAFVMAAIIFTAILCDRPALSMRNLALALFVVIAFEPEGILEPGLQMSFAAVAALIAGWEAWRDRPRLDLADSRRSRVSPVLRTVNRALAGTALTTILAGLATAPIGAFHFERIAAYSLLGNMLAMPLVSFVVMPSALAVLILLPFGLEAPALAVMTTGIDGLLAVAHWVAVLDGADVRAPQVGAASLLLMTGGFLWLTLWSERWRLLGILPIALGIVAAPVLYRPADLMVTADAGAMAVRGPDGGLRLVGTRDDSFVAGQFLEKEKSIAEGPAITEGVACDKRACVASAMHGMRVSLVDDPDAFAEDCGRTDIVVSPLRAPPDCRARLVIDAEALARLGAHRVRFDADGAIVIEGEWRRLPRPWQRPRVPPR